MKNLIPALLCLIILNSCSVYEKIPTVSFRGPTLQGVQTQVDLEQVKVDLGLKFLFKNPLNKDILVPEHQFTMFLNGQEIPGNLQRQESFKVLAESEKMVTYTYTFDLSPGSVMHSMNVLGKDNYYEFKAEVELDLKDLGIKVPTSLGKMNLRKHKLEFSFGDTIRLPMLPVIEPTNQAGKIQFTGQLESFDLEPIRNGMTPIVDFFMDAEFDSDLTDPFVDLLLTAEVDVLDPKPLNLFNTKKVNLGDHVVNTLLKPLFPDAPDQWDDFKDHMSPGEVNLMDHFVETYMSKLDQNAINNWAAFKQKWDNFKDSDLKFQYPGANVTGLEIEIPFRIYNPNEFPIQAPSVFASAHEGNYQPVDFQAIPIGNGPIAPKSRRTMKLLLRIDWTGAGQSLLDFMHGQSFTPRLRGQTSVDLGYDLMNVEFDIPFDLQTN